MKRTTLIAALTGAAVLLTGCSSTSGTATPAATSSSVMSSMTPTSSMSSASSMSAQPSAPGSSMSSSASESETAGSTADSEPASSGTASSEMTSGSSAATTKTPVSTSTVGDNTGALDAKSSNWFSAFCGGVAPVVTGAKSLTDLSTTGTSTTAAAKKIAALFVTMGTSLTKTAATLKGLPAPSFSGGAAFATRVVTAFAKSGPALTAGGKKIAADPAQLGSTASGLESSLTAAVAPLQDLDALKLTPATQAAIEKLPACAAVQKAVGG